MEKLEETIVSFGFCQAIPPIWFLPEITTLNRSVFRMILPGNFRNTDRHPPNAKKITSNNQ
jgi:hypothetical protein